VAEEWMVVAAAFSVLHGAVSVGRAIDGDKSNFYFILL
jgi:hypothetical protein